MRSFLFTCFFLCSLTVLSQSSKSLYKKLHSESNKLEYATKLRELYLDESLDSLFGMGKYLMKEGINKDNQSWIMYGKLILGNYYTQKFKSKQGIDYLQQCEKYYSKRKDFLLLADVQNLIGLNYIYLTEYDQAADYFVKSLGTAEELGEDNESFMGQLNLAEIYIRKGKLDMAEAEVKSYLEKTKKRNLYQGQRKAYDVLSKIAIQQKDYESALQYAKHSFELSMKHVSKVGKAISYTNLAIVYFETGNDKLALENFQNALTLHLESGNSRFISEAYFNLGEWNFYLNNYEEAIPFYEKSLQIAIENDLLVEISDAHNQLAACYKALGDYPKAINNLEEYISKIKLIQRNNQNKDADFQRIAYELDVEERMLEQKKREDKINERIQKEQNRARFIVIGFSIIGIVFLGYFIFQRLNTSIYTSNITRSKESQIILNMKSELSTLDRIEHYVDTIGINNLIFDNLLSIGKSVVYLINDYTYVWLPLPFSTVENFLIQNYCEKNKGNFKTIQEFKKGLSTLNFVNLNDFECVQVSIIKNEFSIKPLDRELYLFPENKIIPSGEEFVSDNFCVICSSRGYTYLKENQKINDFKKQIELISSMNSKLAKSLIEETWSTEMNNGLLHVLFKKN